MTAPDIIRICSIYSIAAPLSAYIVKFRLLQRHHHILGALIAFTILWEGMGMCRFGRSQSTALLFNGYFASMFFLLSWFYYEIYFRNRAKKLFFACLSIYIISTICFSWWVKNIYSYQGEIWAVGAAILITNAILYTKELPALTSLMHLRSAKSPDLLTANFGFFYYYSFNFFLFTISDYVLTEMSPSIAQTTWAFHNLNNIIKNIFLATSFLFVNQSFRNRATGIRAIDDESVEIKKAAL